MKIYRLFLLLVFCSVFLTANANHSGFDKTMIYPNDVSFNGCRPFSVEEVLTHAVIKCNDGSILEFVGSTEEGKFGTKVVRTYPDKEQAATTQATPVQETPPQPVATQETKTSKSAQPAPQATPVQLARQPVARDPAYPSCPRGFVLSQTMLLHRWVCRRLVVVYPYPAYGYYYGPPAIVFGYRF